MNARLVRIVVMTICAAGLVVLVATTADLVHLVHASLLLALGAGVLLGRPRTG
jgi:hypothetical protein